MAKQGSQDHGGIMPRAFNVHCFHEQWDRAGFFTTIFSGPARRVHPPLAAAAAVKPGDGTKAECSARAWQFLATDQVRFRFGEVKLRLDIDDLHETN